MAYAYSFQKFDKETQARASATNLQISMKKTVETVRHLKGKKLAVAIKFLEAVTEEKAVVPYKKYRAEMGHKKGSGIDTGGYPVNVAKELLKLLKSAEKNAKEQEISGDLYLISLSARKGQTRYHYGRHSGRQMKATNVEVIVGVKK